jgi:DNA replication protein DnaC
MRQNMPEYSLLTGTAPYKTCDSCVVKEWCGRRSGAANLPKDYALNPECSGNIMLERALALSGIPKEYRGANKRTFKTDADNIEHAEFLTGMMDNPIGMVDEAWNLALLNFGKGTGKTYTACTIANEYIYKACMNPAIFDYENPLVLYVNFGEWCNDIRKAHQVRDNPSLYEQMYDNIDRMKKVPLLILDDIGSGRITDIIRDLTYDVVNKRKEEQKATIYTSNLVDAMLRQNDCLGDIIVSRMMYKTAIVPLGGRDRRQEVRF